MPASAPSPSERLGYAYGVVGVIIFGLTFPMTRLAVLELDPYVVACGRAVLAGACALLVLALTRQGPPPRRDWGRLLRYGLCVIIGFPVMATVALQSAPAGHGGVIAAVLPLATAMASVAVAGERPSLAFWLCGIAGSAAVLVYAWLHGAGTGGFQPADLLLLAAVSCAAWGYAEGAVLSRTFGGWQTISWALVSMLPVMIGLTGLALWWSGGIDTGASAAAWLGFVYVGVFSMYLGFFAWNRGLVLGGIAKVGQVQLLQTFVTLGGAALLNGERIGAMEIGFAVIVVALVAIGSQLRVRR